MHKEHKLSYMPFLQRKKVSVQAELLAPYTEFLSDVVSMELEGAHADVQKARYLLTPLSVLDEVGYLDFSRRQCRVSHRHLLDKRRDDIFEVGINKVEEGCLAVRKTRAP